MLTNKDLREIVEQIIDRCLEIDYDAVDGLLIGSGSTIREMMYRQLQVLFYVDEDEQLVSNVVDWQHGIFTAIVTSLVGAEVSDFLGLRDWFFLRVVEDYL